MKTKYIIYSLVFIFTALFTNSCKNEDVIITAPGILHINTMSVIKPFIYKVKEGDLATLNLEEKLNITLFIFDDNDKLVKSDLVYIDTYSEDEVYELNLKPGNYSVVALSSVVTVNENRYDSKFWKISRTTSGTSKSTIEVKYLDDKYYNSKSAILGVGQTKVSINNNEYEYNLDLKPAGTLLCYRVLNPRALGTTNSYRLVSNKSNDMMKILNYDTYEYYCKEAEGNNVFSLMNLRASNVDTSTVTSYGYVFMLPMDNVSFMFVYTNSEMNYLEPLTENMVVDCKPGFEYDIWINLKDNKNYNEITYGIENKTPNSARSSEAQEYSHVENSFEYNPTQAIPLTDILKMVNL